MNADSPHNVSPLNSPGVSWTRDQQRELITAYVQRMDVDMMAMYFGVRSREVIVELASLILDAPSVTRDRTKPRFGTKWTLRDYELVTQQFQLGADLSDIADVVERDELGVAYWLLQKMFPPIPRATLKTLGLEGLAEEFRDFERDSDESDTPKICPVCKDVVLYCKCNIRDDRVF
jgi:hypothetical protein